jgi:methyl-accepting chemotaxis protein
VTVDWSTAMYVGLGAMGLLVGIGVLVACLAFAKTMNRLNRTLDVVDAQVETLSVPATATLEHIGGIADTADQTLARLKGVVTSLETLAASLTNVADLAKEAVSPAIVNVGATIAGVSAGLRRIVKGRTSDD